MTDYKQLTDNIRNQINPEGLLYDSKTKAAFESIQYSDVLTFVKTAMKSVGPEYTKRTIDAGDRVKGHLNDKLEDKEFKCQGSVMTDTHIKGYSDIDLLVISKKSYSLDAKGVNASLLEQNLNYNYRQKESLQREISKSSYNGDQLGDLKKLRTDSEYTLLEVYMDCDTSKPKA
ncbi:MAG: nucleotidyltransferase domain-containing protein, partial [Bacteroidales bacterium]